MWKNDIKHGWKIVFHKKKFADVAYYAYFCKIYQISGMIKGGYAEESGLLRLLLTTCDLALMLLCLVGCYYFYHVTEPVTVVDVDLQVYIVVAIMCYIPVFFYSPSVVFERSAGGEKVVARAFQTVVTHVLFIFATLFLLKHEAIARVLLLTFAVVFLVALVLERMILLKILRHFRSMGKNVQNVVFVGHVGEMEDLYDHMKNKEYGYNVEGLFTEDPHDMLPDLPLLGTPSQVLDFVQTHPYVNAIYCTMARMSKEDLVTLYKYCEDHLIRFYALPMYLGYLRRNMRIQHIGSTVVLSPRKEPLRALENRFAKRIVDIFVSGVFLLTLFPVIYIIVAIIIKRQSPGPVIFAQKRNGLNGEVFTCYKFRSMDINEGSDEEQAGPNDVRRFPFGAFMRRTNIDELPQFVNVFLGDMSVVGPRPHMLKHTEQYSRIVSKYMVRHWVKPGITGWAQVNGFRGETREVEMMEKRIRADIWYIENWNFWLDIRIIWRTLINTLFHHDENAY